MTESFEKLLKNATDQFNIKVGSIIKANVILINKDVVVVDSGLKSESNIPIEQFYNSLGELEIKIGDIVDVILESIENGFGETLLSREKAKRYETWMFLEKSQREGLIISGVITGRVKGGFTVDLKGIRAFLPGSLVDIKPVRDIFNFEGQEIDFKVVKLDKKRNNVVVSRRFVFKENGNDIDISDKNKLIEYMQEGRNIQGIVKNLTDYGAFLDLGGMDGLLHITDISWKRVKHPREILNLGDTITVKVLKFDKERIRVSLGLKQLYQDPWVKIKERYPIGCKVIGRVTNLTDYGCFVEISDGIEGLVHISELDWTNKNVIPSKIINVDDNIEVMVLNIDEERRRISLGLKQCIENPWEKFALIYTKGSHIQGKIKSITDFGIFVSLPEGIDGLVHVSDISWIDCIDKDIVNIYKKGEEITVVLLQVDIEKERISLGIKQLTEDPLNKYCVNNLSENQIFIGKILSIDNTGIKVILENQINGYITFSNFSSINIENIINGLNIGNNIKVQVKSVDKKNRLVNLILAEQIEEKNNINHVMINSTLDNCDNNKLSNAMIEAFKAATKINNE